MNFKKKTPHRMNTSSDEVFFLCFTRLVKKVVHSLCSIVIGNEFPNYFKTLQANKRFLTEQKKLSPNSFECHFFSLLF